MSLIPDELKTRRFPCPNCGKYISDETEFCGHCNFRIDVDSRSKAIEGETAAIRDARIASEKRTLIIGGAILGAGLFNLFAGVFEFRLNYTSGLQIPCISIIAIIFGFGVTILGLRGYLRAKNSL